MRALYLLSVEGKDRRRSTLRLEVLFSGFEEDVAETARDEGA